MLEFDGRTKLRIRGLVDIASTDYPPMTGLAKVVGAERATALEGAVRESNQPPQNGKEAVRLGTRGAAMQWTDIDGGEGGLSTIGFNYSLGAGSNGTRRAKLSVNDVAEPDLTFLSTGNPKFWHQLYVPVPLAAGKANKIRIECDDEGGETINELRVHPAAASAPEPDQQNFIALKTTHMLKRGSSAVRGGYGDFCPVRVTDSAGGPVETFVYPRSAGDPYAKDVLASFVRKGPDFSSVLGRVQGTLYVGRTSAGGVGDGIDLNNDGRKSVVFDRPCAFILKLHRGRITALETDRRVTATLGARKLDLLPFTPVTIQ